MTTPLLLSNPCARILSALVLFAIVFSFPLRAQAPAGGSIEGRVLNVTTGAYLNNARVTVEGTMQQAFSNEFGEYRIGGLPAGTYTVRAFYTGMAPQSAQVRISAGQTVAHHFNFSVGDTAPAADAATVQLDAFVVAAVKETNASAIAVNEQRFAENIKNVVASDEFGAVAEGNVGEFLKFLPGVTLDYQSADARSVSIRGMPSSSTAVTIDGNSIANTGAGVANRTFEFDQLSINNVSRVEVTKGPTPDSRADAIGGTVNLVSKSAFERSRPEFSYRAHLSLNHQHQQDVQYLSLGESPGPGREPSTKVKPSFEFTYVNPLTKNFGFTVTGMSSNIFNQQYTSSPRWSPTSNVGSAGTLATLANPAMTSYAFIDGPKNTSRYSVGATIDWRLAPRHVVSLRGSWNAFDAFFNNKSVTLNTAAPTAHSPTFTQGGNGGSVSSTTSTRMAARRTYSVSAKYRHDGRIWKVESDAYVSNSRAYFRDMDYGWFNSTQYSLTAVRLRFDGLNETRPDVITATDGAGVPLDVRQLANYRLTLVNTNPVDSFNTNKGASGSVSRLFDVGVPIRAKLGVDARRVVSEARRPFQQWTFVGPDRVANNADNAAGNYDLVDRRNSSIPAPYGNGAWQYPSPWNAYDLFRAHPEYFVHDDAFQIQQAALNSNVITEDIISEYLRFDARLFENRLWIVAGVRYERTRDDGYGPLNDITQTYQRDAQGNFIRNAAGRPVAIVGDAATLARLRYVDRGSHVTKDYGDFYPSLNLTWNVTPKLIARASYADTLARPNYGNIIPGTTLPDPAGTSRIITINNVDLKPWTAKNYDVAVSFYPEKGGEISAGVFRKDVKDFFGTRDVDVTPELLDRYEIDQTYAEGGYLIRTLQNAGDARITGAEFNYRQPLTFLPAWAKGVNIRYNITSVHLEGNTLSDFSTFIRRSQNWGISLDRPKYNVRLNWNYRGRQRQGAIAGTAEPGTFAYMHPRLTLDCEAEYRFSRRLGLFFGARNITGAPFIIERYGPNTPAYARTHQRNDYGIAISAGVKGSF